MGQTTIKTIALKSEAGVAISNTSILSTVALTTAPVYVGNNLGFATLVVIENIAGGAGDVDIYAEYSDDGTTWARYYNSDMAGAITVEGNIVTALQNVTRRIGFTVRMAGSIRFVFDPDADSRITASLTYLEDK